jgi:hypothetical protein
MLKLPGLCQVDKAPNIDRLYIISHAERPGQIN